MLGIVHSCCCLGMNSHLVRVEVDVSPGLPSFTIVGLPDTAVRESTERVRSAIKNSGFEFPMRRITVNLAPADLRKEGSLFDLPIAVGVLAATEQVPREKVGDYIFVGELSLDGSICSVPGIILMASSIAKDDQNSRKLIIPLCNLEEALLVEEGVSVLGSANLSDVIGFLRGEKSLHEGISGVSGEKISTLLSNTPSYEYPDFSDVTGQEKAKRALEIAAAGGHNVLLVGPPGSGKTMLARRLPSIMPPLSWEEAVEVTKIYSIAGLLSKDSPLVSVRPFRAPHHTASAVSIIGGGRIPRPGEVSLASHGILFMDELPEFSRDVLEALRQPLEEKIVTISRAAGSYEFPAKFTFVGAMNPCPCGFWGDLRRGCTCTPHQAQKYRNRISGPILDRIDLHIEVPRIELEEIAQERQGEPSAEIRKRVVKAREIQMMRFINEGINKNSDMDSKQIKKYCRLSKESRNLLYNIFQKLNLSMRSFDRLLKVARTIADLEASEEIRAEHIAEAVQYRFLDRPLTSEV